MTGVAVSPREGACRRSLCNYLRGRMAFLGLLTKPPPQS